MRHGHRTNGSCSRLSDRLIQAPDMIGMNGLSLYFFTKYCYKPSYIKRIYNVNSYNWFKKYFTCQIQLNQGKPKFLGWKTWVESQLTEHNRTSSKSVLFFVARVLEPEFGHDLVRWGTCIIQVPHQTKSCPNSGSETGVTKKGTFFVLVLYSMGWGSTHVFQPKNVDSTLVE